MLIELIIIFAVILFFGVMIAVAVIVSRKTKSGLPPNSPLLINFDKSLSQGYSLMIIKEMKSSTFDNRLLLNVRPFDLKYNGSTAEMVEDFEFPIRKERLISLPVGSFSDKRNIYFLMPGTPAELGENLRNTSFGDFLNNYVQNINTTDKAVELIKGNEKKEKTELTMLERNESRLRQQQDEFIKQVIKNQESRGFNKQKEHGDDKNE